MPTWRLHGNGSREMNFGPNYLYSDTLDECTPCSKPLKTVPGLGIYLVGNRGAIQYPLCLKCIKVAQKGLPPDLLRKLDQKLEQRARELGLTQTQ